jgi:hypothetical protein
VIKLSLRAKQRRERMKNVIDKIINYIGVAAAIIAAYYSVKIYPKKAKKFQLQAGKILFKEINSSWDIEIDIINYEKEILVKDAMVIINTSFLKKVDVNYQTDSHGITLIQNTIITDKSVNYPIEKLKPRTCFPIYLNVEAEPGEYQMKWNAYGPNLKDISGEFKLMLTY